MIGSGNTQCTSIHLDYQSKLGEGDFGEGDFDRSPSPRTLLYPPCAMSIHQDGTWLPWEDPSAPESESQRRASISSSSHSPDSTEVQDGLLEAITTLVPPSLCRTLHLLSRYQSTSSDRSISDQQQHVFDTVRNLSRLYQTGPDVFNLFAPCRCLSR